MDPKTKLEKGAFKQFGFVMLIFGMAAIVLAIIGFITSKVLEEK